MFSSADSEESINSVPDIVTDSHCTDEDFSAPKCNEKTLTGNTSDVILDTANQEKEAAVVRPTQMLVTSLVSTAAASAKRLSVRSPRYDEYRSILMRRINKNGGKRVHCKSGILARHCKNTKPKSRSANLSTSGNTFSGSDEAKPNHSR